MKHPFFALLLLLILIVNISCGTCVPQRITRVSINSIKTKQKKELKHEEIEYLESVLAVAGNIDKPPDYSWSHKFDIVSEKCGGRWLYNKEGYFSKLNYFMKPSYRILEPTEFNRKLLDLDME